MERQHVEQLLRRLALGDATEAEKKEIERLIETGSVSLQEIADFAELDGQLTRLDSPAPSSSLDHDFYHMLSAAKAGRKGSTGWQFFSWPVFAPRLALAAVTLLIGVAAGYLLRPSSVSAPGQIEALSRQVSDLQEMMMLSLLEQGSATDRLKAVNLTQEMTDASRKVTSALIRTLNEDENVNVRLAALEALKPYARDSSVRAALIHSIANQESPLVQVSLAELMVALQEKSAVREFEKIITSEKTPSEVKKKIRESLEVLI